MKSGFNHFDILYFINLECRPDRLEHITNEINKTNIDKNKIHRINAFYTPHMGALGCSMSHIKALEQFLETPEDIQHCLIMEDDFEFTQEQDVVNKLLDEFFNSGENYDVFTISTNIQKAQPTKYPFLQKIIDAQALSGYCVHRNYAPILIENYKESVKLLEEKGWDHYHCCDIHMKILQPNHNWYCIHPKIGKQMCNFSNIENKNVDYGV